MDNKIIIFQRILPHYRAGIFRKLCKRFPGTKVIYGQPFKYESLKNADDLRNDIFIKCSNTYFSRDGKVFISKIYSRIKEIKPDIIISVFNVGNLNIYILFILRKFLNFRIILWSFGYDPESGFIPDKKITAKIRLYLSQKADAVIFYWDNGKHDVSRFSKKPDHYFTAPNTLDTVKQTEFKETFDLTGKENIKAELGVSERYHFVYIGRLLEDKQVDLLIKAYGLLDNELVYIINYANLLFLLINLNSVWSEWFINRISCPKADLWGSISVISYLNRCSVTINRFLLCYSFRYLI